MHTERNQESDRRAPPHAPLPRFKSLLKRAQGPALWLFLGLAATATAASGALLLSRDHSNDLVRQMRAGKEIAVDPASAAPAVLEARAHFLLTRDRLDEAQPLLDQAALRAPDPVHARMLYNIGNARLRAALASIEQGHYDRAIPLVALAKSDYRSALRINPQDWDARHNLDVAMRLVRDLPTAEGEGDGDEKPPAKLWTDLPGVPKGLP
jgi:mxaK protein